MGQFWPDSILPQRSVTGARCVETPFLHHHDDEVESSPHAKFGAHVCTPTLRQLSKAKLLPVYRYEPSFLRPAPSMPSSTLTSLLSAEAPVTSIVFNNGSKEAGARQRFIEAYCLSPPLEHDGCPYGPCPNPDVTGIGQQISSQFTVHTSCTLTLMYPVPWFSLYHHRNVW